MANRTVKDAKSIRGTNPQYLIEKIIRSRIYDSKYWKEECFALTAELLVDKAMELRYVGGVHGGFIYPTPFLCLVLKMLQIQPEKDIVVEFIKNEEFKYVRALGAFYMRLTGTSVDCYKYLEPLYNDNRKLRRQNREGQFEIVHVDEFIDELLREERLCDVILPRIQKRHFLEENNELEPKVSALDDDLDEDMPSDDENVDTEVKEIKRDKERRGDKILWSDESTFKKDGYMNLHNLHEWHVENPHLMREDRSQYRFKVNMWTGILCGNIIGPFEMPENLTGESYLNFLQNDLPNLLEETPPDMWFQHDGCPAHFRVSVREFLDEQYPNRWIGRSGTIPWPARSPDLNPLDFFFWGTMKELVYAKPINDIADLREKITQAVQVIRQKSYSRNIKRSFLRRVRACIAAGGQHFEHLL